MRVAYICADAGVPVFGVKGSSRHVQEVIRAFLQNGSQVDLYASRIGGGVPRGLEPVTLKALTPPPKGDVLQREVAELAANRELRRALEKDGPYDMVYERYSLWSYAGMAYARSIGAPGVLEVNAPLIEEQEKYRTLVRRAHAERVARRAFRSASALLAVSHQVASHVKSYGDGVSGIHVIPNGVDTERFRPDMVPAHPYAPDEFVIGFAGSLKPWHGLEVLMEAFDQTVRHHPSSRLLIVGDGPGYTELESEIERRGLEKTVRLIGQVAHDAVPHWLTAMDLAVAPYPAIEGFYFSPLKVFEYMAAGLPVVASDLGQISEVVEDRVSGLLVDPGDPGKLASAFDLLIRKPELRIRLGTAARRKVAADHSWQAIARRVFSLAGVKPRASLVCEDLVL
ncbi:MAG: glycosyltransferase family 4 protein [Anaerolineae bacterium]|nr:glycosyltransferase family 4 protein [Anaerolineae bacterium]